MARVVIISGCSESGYRNNMGALLSEFGCLWRSGFHGAEEKAFVPINIELTTA